jgi:hypothetical protein
MAPEGPPTKYLSPLASFFSQLFFELLYPILEDLVLGSQFFVFKTVFLNIIKQIIPFSHHLFDGTFELVLPGEGIVKRQRLLLLLLREDPKYEWKKYLV